MAERLPCDARLFASVEKLAKTLVACGRIGTAAAADLAVAAHDEFKEALIRWGEESIAAIKAENDELRAENARLSELVERLRQPAEAAAAGGEEGR